MNQNSNCKGYQNTLTSEWYGCKRNFQTVAYVPELDHRPKKNGEARMFGKEEFGEFEGF